AGDRALRRLRRAARGGDRVARALFALGADARRRPRGARARRAEPAALRALRPGRGAALAPGGPVRAALALGRRPPLRLGRGAAARGPRPLRVAPRGDRAAGRPRGGRARAHELAPLLLGLPAAGAGELRDVGRDRPGRAHRSDYGPARALRARRSL